MCIRDRAVAELRHRGLDAFPRDRIHPGAVVDDARDGLTGDTGARGDHRHRHAAAGLRPSATPGASLGAQARLIELVVVLRHRSASPRERSRAPNSGLLTLSRRVPYRVYVNMETDPEFGTPTGPTAAGPADAVLSVAPLGAGVVRRTTVLADGRDLVYYDDPDTTRGAERSLDARVLDPRPDTAAMRQDVLLSLIHIWMCIRDRNRFSMT